MFFFIKLKLERYKILEFINLKNIWILVLTMEIELPNIELTKNIEGSKTEEENLYNKLQELNKFLTIQEEYIKEDQIKLKR